ncbi:zinc finger protein Noc-like [Macrosteles quadrilineatus]|uniref:zinc finger protein Noc-like n=1 Tax=Macrosteles quadrilineatus TaxID=74068 RepID=UPI0023E1932F|nr:zinc finger protein Noc-like [Macrosteles quadrilineatus]
MVVLESGIMSSGSNQYLQPDYLSPLPTTLDAKKSPLALLAQTCSQIGADNPPSKPLLSALDKPKKPSSERHSPASGSKPAAPEPLKTQEPRLAFKPYENNVLTRKAETPRPSSKGHESAEEKRKTPSRKSSSPHDKSSPAPATETKSVSPANSGASPIIRSGLEILQGHPKDMPLGTFKPSMASFSGLGGCCPPGLEASNPAFRPPFAGGPFSPHHAAMLAGFPSAPGPYVSYARVKTAAGGEALVPVCKDPYCTGCQLSMHSALLGGGTCPSGCTQCDHQKYNLAAAAALSGLVPPPHPFSYQSLGRPYVCNWIAGESYCGKRFTTSDELLQHLRTHTASAETASLLNPLRYPNPPLSPLSAARYHPYSKPGLPGSLGASPFSAFNPTLGPYYSPYALYGQRLGAAAVHP